MEIDWVQVCIFGIGLPMAFLFAWYCTKHSKVN